MLIIANNIPYDKTWTILNFNNKPMKTLQQLEQEVLDLQTQINEFKNKPKSIWYLKDGDYCFCIEDNGRVIPGRYDSESVVIYNQRINQGNAFLTEEEAEKERDRRFALSRIKKYIFENNLEFEPNWKNKEYKYAIYYGYDINSFFIDSCRVGNELLLLPYFETFEYAKKVIKNCEADLKILFNLN